MKDFIVSALVQHVAETTPWKARCINEMACKATLAHRQAYWLIDLVLDGSTLRLSDGVLFYQCDIAQPTSIDEVVIFLNSLDPNNKCWHWPLVRQSTGKQRVVPNE